MKSIYEELALIKKYTLRYLEETTEVTNREELEMAEEHVYRSKRDREIAHLVALNEEEERRLEDENFMQGGCPEPDRVVQIMLPGAGSKKQIISQPVINWTQVSQGFLPHESVEVAMERKVAMTEVIKTGKKQLETLEIRIYLSIWNVWSYISCGNTN